MPVRIPEEPRLYIPSLGRIIHVDLLDVTEEHVIGPQGFVERTSPFDFAVRCVGAHGIDPAGMSAYRDMEMEQGRDAAGALVIERLTGGPAGTRTVPLASLSLYHLLFFFPQLHELRIGLEVRDYERITLRGPPGLHVILGGVQKRPIK